MITISILKRALRLPLKIFTLCVYLFTIISAYGGYINPNITALPSVFTLMLPYLAIATAVLAVLWLLDKRFITAIAGILVLVGCATPIQAAFPMGKSVSATPGHNTFTLLSYNSLHLWDYYKEDTTTNRSVEMILRTNADIVALQELESLSESETPGLKRVEIDSLVSRYPYRIFTKNGDFTLLSKYPAREIKFPGEDYGGLYWFVPYSINTPGGRITLISVHLPSYSLSEQERNVVTGIHGISSAKGSVKEFKGTILSKLNTSFQLRALWTERLIELIEKCEKPVIICGDFNDVPSSWCYRQLVKAGMKDACAETNFGHVITYNAHLFLFHIDQVMYCGALKSLSVKKINEKISDHYPLLSTFQFSKPSPRITAD